LSGIDEASVNAVESRAVHDERVKTRSVLCVAAGLGRRLDPDATARQRLAEKDLDLGVDAAQVGYGAPFHRVKNRFLRPERKGNAFRARGPSSLGHDAS
jgi:hypothetical protein